MPPVQPPSGGCVLKLCVGTCGINRRSQPPSGGCVLKLHGCIALRLEIKQPPSGGCVLKHLDDESLDAALSAAAFGRLCVET